MKLKGFYLFLGGAVLAGILYRESFAVELTIQNATSTINDLVEVQVLADDPSQIAGAVLTINYDPTSLALFSVAGAPFFDVFGWNNSVPGKILFCGARKQILPGVQDTTALTLKFSVSGTATGDYLINMQSSLISNTQAGYNQNGELVPVIVSANLSSSLPSAYPVLSSVLVSGQLGIDRDNDGLKDTEETTYGTNINNPDTDGDGMKDLWEVRNRQFVNPLVNDALLDADHDGYSNLREYLSNTEPGVPDEPAELLVDIDGNEIVDGYDLVLFVNEMAAACSGPSCLCDFDGNGQVDHTDLKLFTEEFSRVMNP